MSNSDADILLPPLLPVTADDHGAYVVLSSFLLVILTFFVIGVAFGSRFKIVGGFLMSDYLLLLATIIFLVEAICMRCACTNGLGRHRSTLSDSSFEQYSKYFYASQILTHIALACTKLSMVLLVISIKPFRPILIASHVVTGVICLWCVLGIFTLAFQCDQPRPWDFTPGRCLNQQALYIGIGVGSIVTDVAITVLPCIMISKVQVSLKKRATVAALFSTRIIVPISTVILLAKFTPFFDSQPIDQPFQAVQASVWTQIILSLSIVTACIPGLKRFLADLQTGLMAGAIPEFYEMSATPRDKYYTSSTHNSDRETGTRREYPSGTPLRSVDDTHRNSSTQKGSGSRKSLRRAGLMNRGNSVHKSDSVENLTDNEIVQTMEYEVRYEAGQYSESDRHYALGIGKLS